MCSCFYPCFSLFKAYCLHFRLLSRIHRRSRLIESFLAIVGSRHRCILYCSQAWYFCLLHRIGSFLLGSLGILGRRIFSCFLRYQPRATWFSPLCNNLMFPTKYVALSKPVLTHNPWILMNNLSIFISDCT